MMMITTTSSTSPTPRPTLSLRSEAFLLILEASARKRSLEVFSRSDLESFSVESHNRTWTCLEGLKGCCLCRGRPQCCFSSPQSPWDWLKSLWNPIPFTILRVHLLNLASQPSQTITQTWSCREFFYKLCYEKSLPCKKKSSSSLAVLPPPSNMSPSSSPSSIGSSLSSISACSPP